VKCAERRPEEACGRRSTTHLSYQYGLRGRTGYYEVAEDGSLGEFLGLKTPLGLSAMRRSKA
jgi:hypothetical protein